jgi:hypothetical protein
MEIRNGSISNKFDLSIFGSQRVLPKFSREFETKIDFPRSYKETLNLLAQTRFSSSLKFNIQISCKFSRF